MKKYPVVLNLYRIYFVHNKYIDLSNYIYKDMYHSASMDVYAELIDEVLTLYKYERYYK